jgi:hypothetical protein
MATEPLTTKVPQEEANTLRRLAEERGTTVSALIRELLQKAVRNGESDWNAPCFGGAPLRDEARYPQASIDELAYGGADA